MEAVKHESVKLLFSILFFLVCLTVLWFMYPKLSKRFGAAQAEGFWTQERKEQEKRLFGDGE